MSRISIVTVSFNAAHTLRDTLESVQRQLGAEVEHWLIDGASTDGTRDVVTRSGRHLAGFISEPDKGLYDAMNKGAKRCSGDVLGFLNADDWYAGPDVLSAVALAFAQGADLVYGNLDFVSPEPPHRVVRRWRDQPHTPHDLMRKGWVPAHPTTYIRTDLFHKLGGFDPKWSISADFAFLSSALMHPGVRLAFVPRTLVNMRVGGASTAGLGAIWRSNLQCARALSELRAPHPWATILRKLAFKIPQMWAGPNPDGASLTPVPIWKPWE